MVSYKKQHLINLKNLFAQTFLLNFKNVFYILDPYNSHIYSEIAPVYQNSIERPLYENLAENIYVNYDRNSTYINVPFDFPSSTFLKQSQIKSGL